jgi:hypothetical protein
MAPSLQVGPVVSNELKQEYITSSTDWPPFVVTIFPDVLAKRYRTENHTIDSLATLCFTKRKSKSECELLKLASFGDNRSEKGSLRHDANIVAIHGIEIDYDGELISFADARDRLAQVGVGCVIYTSPSHSPEKPRWRVLCPTGEPIGAQVRSRLCDLLNGLFGGLLARESWTLSQSYYFGNCGGRNFRCEVVAGEPIDACAFAGVVGKAPSDGQDPSGLVLNLGLNDGAKVNDWLLAIRSGTGWHNAVRDLVARQVAKGLSDEEILLIAAGVRQDGWSLEQTEGEMREFIDSARRKGLRRSRLMRCWQVRPERLLRSRKLRLAQRSRLGVRGLPTSFGRRGSGIGNYGVGR